MSFPHLSHPLSVYGSSFKRVFYVLKSCSIPHLGGGVSILFGDPGGGWIQPPSGNPIDYNK